MFFVEIFLDGTGNMLFESTLMRTSLSRMLSVDKRVILFTILAGMRKGYLNIFSLQMMMGYNPTAVMLSLSKSTNPLRDKIR